MSQERQGGERNRGVGVRTGFESQLRPSLAVTLGKSHSRSDTESPPLLGGAIATTLGSCEDETKHYTQGT